MKPTKLKLKKKLTSTMIYNAKKFFLFSLIFLFSTSIFSQNIEWEQNYGGSAPDEAYSISQTSDGGYIVAGSSKSQDGDVSGTFGYEDYWVVKLDSSGNIEWEETYGGSFEDIARSVQQTGDGGYIVAGHTGSDDGDVSSNTLFDDCWVIKLDASGSIIWENNYDGGDSFEEATSIQQTDDGGYIVTGYSTSDNGNVSADGIKDYWVLKLDGSGNIEWENNYGGSDRDEAYSIRQTDDGGYIVAGNTLSGDGDVSLNNGGEDYWVMKLDGSGSIAWEENYGGTLTEEANSIRVTDDGGYIVAGISSSLGGDGDVSGNNGNKDYWVVKLDSTGSIEWEGNYGGNDWDQAYSIRQTDNGGYIVVGYSWSGDGDISSNNGFNDYWVVKIDGSGSIEWEANYGGSDLEGANSIEVTDDGGYIVAGWSRSSDGDVSGNKGSEDFWIVKLSGSNMGISQHDRQHKINIYPNPTSGKINIQMNDIQSDKLEIKLSNISGQVVLRQTRDFATNFAIDINGGAGIYFLEIVTDNNKKFIQQIVKK